MNIDFRPVCYFWLVCSIESVEEEEEEEEEEELYLPELIQEITDTTEIQALNYSEVPDP